MEVGNADIKNGTKPPKDALRWDVFSKNSSGFNEEQVNEMNMGVPAWNCAACARDKVRADISLSFLAFIYESLKLYYIKNVAISNPIPWLLEMDPCCLEHEQLAILRTQVQCLLSSLFVVCKWINLASVGEFQFVTEHTTLPVTPWLLWVKMLWLNIVTQVCYVTNYA